MRFYQKTLYCKFKITKSWGDCTDTKEILSLRNKKIYYDYCDGISVQQLAQKYFLAEKSIQRIIRYEKNNR